MKDKLERILSKVGDLSFRKKILTLLDYLDIQPGDKILDAGCGEGFYVMLLDELYGCQVVGLDNDPKILKQARKWVEEKENVKFVRGDITKLPFEDESFDKIICSEVLEHVPDDKKALTELHRVLKKGGFLGLTVPNHNYPFLWDPLNWIRERLGLGHFNPDFHFLGGIWSMHLRLYYPPELKKNLEESGFKIEKIEGLVHYCLPFNHNILYLGKQFYTKLPVPGSVSSSMEKFEWRKDDGGSRFNLLRWGLKLLKRIDSLNETHWDGCGSSVDIAVKAVK